MALRIPVSTYRVQLNQAFGFAAAEALVPYLQDLGITDMYSSPVLRARPGSTHGYDVIDPTALNPELGIDAAFESLTAALRTRGMGLLLDIVPNHLAAVPENPWWADVLANGRASPHARVFDIDWDSPIGGLRGRLLVPLLGDAYRRVLQTREIGLGFDAGGFFLRYHEHRLPLSLRSWGEVLETGLKLFGHALDGDAQARQEIERIIAVALGGMSRNPLAHESPRRESHSNPLAHESPRRERVGVRVPPLPLGRQPASPLVLRTEQVGEDLVRLRQRSPAAQRFLDWTLDYFNGTPDLPSSFAAMDRVLDHQSYRLAFWRVTTDAINYRRFFDINHLAGVRVEDPGVFAATHAFLLALARRAQVTGFRADHIDGLADPLGYLCRLPSSFYVVVEKILAGGEALPESWPVAGTTGYDFLNTVNGLFVDPRGLRRLKAAYRRFTGLAYTLQDLVHEKKRQTLEEAFNAELQALGRPLAVLAAEDSRARDIPLPRLLEALTAFSACLPVYRTYLRRGDEPSAQDRAILLDTLRRAARIDNPLLLSEPALSQSKEEGLGVRSKALHFLERVLLPATDGAPADTDEETRWAFITRWQQLTGPLAAKGVEDSALYLYNPLIALNEVGGDGRPVSPAAFHRFNRRRRQSWPHALNATATHDTKRGEDVRARIDVLSEMPEEWEARLDRWSRINAEKKRIVRGALLPDANEETMIYQTLLGAWPCSRAGLPAFRERMQVFATKALREAEVHSSWLHVGEEAEAATLAFIRALGADGRAGGFLQDFLPFQKDIAYYGALNSLSQTLLKVASPGVPDFYQGAELWDLGLVDPDNRRPVDFGSRIEALQALGLTCRGDRVASPSSPLPASSPLSTSLRGGEGGGEVSRSSAVPRDLLVSWRDSRVKLFLIWKALAHRNAHPALYQDGEYLPLRAEGTQAESVIAFARRLGDMWAMAAAPRLVTRVASASNRRLRTIGWDDTALILPRTAPTRWRDVLTGRTLSARGSRLPAARVFADFPVALLQAASIS